MRVFWLMDSEPYLRSLENNWFFFINCLFREQIEVNKRMIQQRLVNTKEESQKKYDKIKLSILNDTRLNFPADFSP